MYLRISISWVVPPAFSDESTESWHCFGENLWPSTCWERDIQQTRCITFVADVDSGDCHCIQGHGRWYRQLQQSRFPFQSEAKGRDQGTWGVFRSWNGKFVWIRFKNIRWIRLVPQSFGVKRKKSLKAPASLCCFTGDFQKITDSCFKVLLVFVAVVCCYLSQQLTNVTLLTQQGSWQLQPTKCHGLGINLQTFLARHVSPVFDWSNGISPQTSCA